MAYPRGHFWTSSGDSNLLPFIGEKFGCLTANKLSPNHHYLVSHRYFAFQNISCLDYLGLIYPRNLRGEGRYSSSQDNYLGFVINF